MTNSSHIHELGPGVDHGKVLSHSESLAAIKAVLLELLAGTSQQQQMEEQQQQQAQERADERAAEHAEGGGGGGSSNSRGFEFSVGAKPLLPPLWATPSSLVIPGSSVSIRSGGATVTVG